MIEDGAAAYNPRAGVKKKHLTHAGRACKMGQVGKIYEDAVYHDLSLNEIAQEHKISKQAVSDLLRRATQQMQEYEQKLSLIARFRRIRSVCDGLEKAARDGSVTPEEVVSAVSVIKKEL